MTMVEQVRRNTQLSYDLSHTAVATVLTQLKENIPALSEVMDNILDTLIQHKVRCHRVWNKTDVYCTITTDLSIVTMKFIHISLIEPC